MKGICELVAGVVGMPSRDYVEDVEINRFNDTGYFELHYDFLRGNDTRDGGDFDGCQRIATAILYLTDAFQGGENVFVANKSFEGGLKQVDLTRDDTVTVQPKIGRLVVLYNVHPMTERVDPESWHGSMPVKGGQKIAATFYVRDCSRRTNLRERDMMKKLMEAVPVSSVGVPEVSAELEDDFEDVDDDEEDEEDYKYLRKVYKSVKAEAESKDVNVTKALEDWGFEPDEIEEMEEDDKGENMDMQYEYEDDEAGEEGEKGGEDKDGGDADGKGEEDEDGEDEEGDFDEDEFEEDEDDSEFDDQGASGQDGVHMVYDDEDDANDIESMRMQMGDIPEDLFLQEDELDDEEDMDDEGNPFGDMDLNDLDVGQGMYDAFDEEEEDDGEDEDVGQCGADTETAFADSFDDDDEDEWDEDGDEAEFGDQWHTQDQTRKVIPPQRQVEDAADEEG